MLFDIPVTDPWLLFAIGLAIVALEIFMLNVFIPLWFGLGMVVVAIVQLLGVTFDSGDIQWITVLLISGLSLYFFREKMRSWVQQAPAMPLETFQTGELCDIYFQDGHWMGRYQGTQWIIANPDNDLADGQKREVINIKHNQLIIKATESADS